MALRRAVFSLQRFLALDNLRTLRSHFGVEGDIVSPFFRYIGFVENRLDRTFRDAGVTIDAMYGVDEEHVLSLVKAVTGTDDDAIGIFAVETGFGNDECHDRLLLRRGFQRDANAVRKADKILINIFTSTIAG
jgi:hypothetical protein